MSLRREALRIPSFCATRHALTADPDSSEESVKEGMERWRTTVEFRYASPNRVV